MNRRTPKSTDSGGGDEVEEMLRAAEEALLLKLSVNGHLTHPSSSDLSPDLSHRFQSLKSGPSTTKPAPSSSTRSQVGEIQSPAPISDDPDDLFARFAALKSSLPMPSSSSVSNVDPIKEESHEEEDEVEKIIRWAVDAARLDPSPDSDDDAVNVSDSDTDSSDDEDDDDPARKK